MHACFKFSGLLWLLKRAASVFFLESCGLNAGNKSKFGYDVVMRNPSAELHRALKTETTEIHARRCIPLGVLGDGSGLHLGDGLVPFSEVAADAEI